MPPRFRNIFLWLLLMLVGMGTAHAADKKIFLAISPLQAKKVDPEEVDLISDALSGELQNTGAFRVMERSQMDRILKEQGLQTSGICEGNECAVEVGKVLGIDRIVVGSVGRIGSMFIINVRMVDVSSGEIVASVRRNQDSELKYVLTSLVPEVAKALASGYHDDQKAAAAAAAAAAPPAVASTTAATSAVPAGAPAPAVSESHGSALPWILGGVAVVGGGAAAYFLLADNKTSSPAPAAADNNNTVAIPVTW